MSMELDVRDWMTLKLLQSLRLKKQNFHREQLEMEFLKRLKNLRKLETSEGRQRALADLILYVIDTWKLDDLLNALIERVALRWVANKDIVTIIKDINDILQRSTNGPK